MHGEEDEIATMFFFFFFGSALPLAHNARSQWWKSYKVGISILHAWEYRIDSKPRPGSLEANDLFSSPGPGLHEADAIEIARRSSSFKLFRICRMLVMDWLSIQYNNGDANASLLPSFYRFKSNSSTLTSCVPGVFSEFPFPFPRDSCWLD